MRHGFRAVILGVLLVGTGYLLAQPPAQPAAPATQPSARAVQRAAVIKKDVKSFGLATGSLEDLTGGLLLYITVKPRSELGEMVGAKALQIQITEAQARKVIDHLLADGFFDRASSIEDAREPERGSHCIMTVGLDGQSVGYYEDLGWGQPVEQRLGGLRQALDGAAGKTMDGFLARLQREWTPAKNPPATQPGPGKATTQPALYRDQLTDPKAVPGQGPALEIEEIERGPRYSILQTRRNRAVHVPPLAEALFQIKAACAIAQARGLPLFATLREWDGPNGTRRCAVGFAADPKVDWTTYFGTEVDPDIEREFMTVREYRFLLGEGTPGAAVPATQRGR